MTDRHLVDKVKKTHHADIWLRWQLSHFRMFGQKTIDWHKHLVDKDEKTYCLCASTWLEWQWFSSTSFSLKPFDLQTFGQQSEKDSSCRHLTQVTMVSFHFIWLKNNWSKTLGWQGKEVYCLCFSIWPEWQWIGSTSFSWKTFDRQTFGQQS